MLTKYNCCINSYPHIYKLLIIFFINYYFQSYERASLISSLSYFTGKVDKCILHQHLNNISSLCLFSSPEHEVLSELL